MNATSPNSTVGPTEPVEARASHSALATFTPWFLPTLVVALALARLAVSLQRSGFSSPLLPIILGGLVGTTAAFLARLYGQPGRATLLIASAVAAVACVAAEHLYFYLEYRVEFDQFVAGQAKLELVEGVGAARPASLQHFMQASAQRSSGSLPAWAWWLIDAALTIVTSVAAALLIPQRARQEARG